MNNIERAKEIVKRLWSQTDLDSIDDLVSQDVAIKSPVKSGKGSSTLSEVVLYWQKAFPDVTSQWLSADEVKPGTVVVNWKAQGTHSGDAFFDVEMTNRTVEYSGKTTYLFEDGKLSAYEANVDIDNILQQLKPTHQLMR
ncbi:MAG: hypothetical protein COV52_08190 [Gammaproteobacteria bacterium CG11_big_fil_rev_8_21_14_0_20_46_22]|nr:MAG: hypothetical protein COW05_06195 [Gammaproteobacteria bacterium CG12_big_fil_rev_8_21_14_0_65_46_12]PIR10587.1 MAG: hypothetical protein COV52_08190 [Gammaproteobacteria bacterium CG11_big_fil_rev_8_21_14_0_20_46_22]